MADVQGRIIAFNGEIYNYQELRRELKGLGTSFSTDSDTEVALAAFAAWGPACLDRFVGMFALAIYDPAREELFLARDRLGKKPLYYLHRDTTLVFASELKALAVHPALREKPDIDLAAVSDYLSLGYILEPRTVFSAVTKLPPGHWASFRLQDGTFTLRSWWDPAPFFLDDKLPANRKTEEEFLGLLQSAVSLRLRADVPVGAFLSGGIDSSSILAVARGLGAEPTAYCVSFAERSYDESDYARLVAESLGTGLHVLQQPEAGPNLLARLVWHLDEPFADTSILPTFQVCEAAASHAKVVLTGDGADELLAGYTTMAADRLFSTYRALPSGVQRAMAGLSRSLLRPRYRKVGWEYKLRQFLSAGGLSPDRAHYHWRLVFSDEEKAGLLALEAQKALRGYDPFDSFGAAYGRVAGACDLDRHLYVDMKTWLPADILVKADRMSMAASVELRSPFLDHRLVEFSARLPAEERMQGLRGKVILRRAMAGRLPRAVLQRPKRGFNFPAHLLWREGTSFAGREGVFRSGFQLDPVRTDVTYKGFALLILQRWLAMYDRFLQTGAWEIVEDGPS